jgi:general secretion pathway protein G
MKKAQFLCRRARRHAQRGMTLIEIMVVLVIIGLVMGMVGVAVFGRLSKAQNDVAGTQIKKIGEALELYKLSFRQYPSTSEGLNALASPKGNEEPFMKEIPKDPWNNEYSYIAPGQRNQGGFDMCSNGKDGVAGSGDDICNYSTGGGGQ